MTPTDTPWKVLVVDDEEGIHGITRMIFRGYEFEQRPIELISAMSAAQARELLEEHSDIALILLDVVMESDNAGLQLVEYIRQQLENRHVRIILRTGHPGYAPEADVIVNYDINDYLSKAELSASRLLTSVVVALRTFREIDSARRHCQEESSSQGDDRLQLKQISQQLQRQSQALLKQSERLQRLELPPMARDLAGDLHCQQLRMHNSTSLLADTNLGSVEQVELEPLCQQLIQTLLPQARREGWLLDTLISPELPPHIQVPRNALELLLLSALELSVLRARGEDLKFSLAPGAQPDQLLVHIQQTTGQPELSNDSWRSLIVNQLQALCSQLGGSWLSDDESGIRLRIRR